MLGQALALPPDISIALLREVWAYDPLPALREIKVPVRAVNADKFPTNFEANRRRAPRFDAVIMKGVGHYLMLEDPKRFGDHLEQALAKVSKR